MEEGELIRETPQRPPRLRRQAEEQDCRFEETNESDYDVVPPPLADTSSEDEDAARAAGKKEDEEQSSSDESDEDADVTNEVAQCWTRTPIPTFSFEKECQIGRKAKRRRKTPRSIEG